MAKGQITKFFGLVILNVLVFNMYGQLNEFEIAPLPNPDTPVVQAYTDYANNALLLIYSDLEGLQFRSSVGAINQQTYNSTAGRYEVLANPLKQMIFVSKPGFMEKRVATINPSPKTVLYFKAETKPTTTNAGRGTLVIESEPANCRILLNDLELADRTPFSRKVHTGHNRIVLQKEGYHDLDTILKIIPDEKLLLHVELTPNWTDLNIHATPNDSRILLDGQFVGSGQWQAEGTSSGLTPGNYSLRIERDRYKPYVELLFLKPGDKKNVNIELEPITGWLNIDSEPSGAKILLDGEQIGQTPFREKQLIGQYEIVVQKGGHLEKKKQISISETEEVSEHFQLKNFRGALTPSKVAKWSFLAIAVGGVSTGGYFLYSSVNDYNQYQTATTDAAQLREDVRHARTIYPIAFAAGGAALIGAIIFNNKVQKKKREWDLTALPLEGGGAIGWTCRF